MKTEQEQIEELEAMVNTHEELLSLIILALVDEECLSADARDAIDNAYRLIYGKK